MDPERLWQMVQRAQADGLDMAEIERGIRMESRGQYRTLADLQQAVGVTPSVTPDSVPQESAAERQEARGNSRVGDFLRLVGQDLTMGFADEMVGIGATLVPGGKTGQEARDASRQRVEDIRSENPGMALAAAGAGMLLPVGGAALGAARGGFRLASRGKSLKGLLGIGDDIAQAGARAQTARRAATAAAPGLQVRLGSTAARVAGAGAQGGAIGAAAGGVYGLGEAEGNLVERLPEAGRGAAIGGLLGGATGAVAGGAGALAGHWLNRGQRIEARNARIGNYIEGLAPDPSTQAVRTATQARKTALSAGYQAVEDLPIADPRIQRFFTADDDLGEAIRKRMRMVERDGRIGKIGPGGLEIRDYQTARRAIQDQIDRAQREGEGGLMNILIQKRRDLDDLVETVVTPDMRPLNRAWRVEQDVPEALKMGRAAAGKSPSELQEALSQYTDPETQQAFRAGLARRLIDQISDKEGPIRMTRSLEEQLRVALGGDETLLKQAEGAIAFERKAALLEMLESTVAGIAGFWFGGTSLFGRLFDG